eukprot:Phypoly_transcript_04147.p1 GENE.Phypoly_transcript_04147~~Phypoly_transcript_04147.p1  ORF type:complete len:475 (+),score=48.18 Phypoly_transcript_04147:674-2098(+)
MVINLKSILTNFPVSFPFFPFFPFLSFSFFPSFPQSFLSFFFPSLIETNGADVPPKPIIENLVFRGGGVKGIAYCGALKVLSDAHLLDNVKRYAGSSAGAITAALLAIGYTISELEEILLALDMSDFKDVNGGWVAKAERLYKKFSLYEGNFFYTWISNCIEKKASPTITFKQVLSQFGKELVIVGACISHMEVVYFSHSSFPDMCIRDALRISMSIPIFFEPIRIEDHVYVDGGLADNFPLCVFDSESSLNARHADVNMKTLGMFLQENKTRQDVARSVDKMQDFIGCLLDTVKMRIAMLAVKPGDEQRTMFIQTHHISATKFNIDKDEKEMLYDEGMKAGRTYISKFGLMYAKPPIWGRLIVHLKHGTGLHHHPLARNLYTVLTLGNVTKKTASKRHNKSNPKWKEIFVFLVNSESDIFKVEVFEELLLSPRLIGSHTVPVNSYRDLYCVETQVDTGKGHVMLDITLSTYVD